MTKLLLLLLIVGGFYFLIRANRRNRNRPDQGSGKPADPQTMVRCAHCGVYLPDADALARGGLRFCSEEHRRLGARS